MNHSSHEIRAYTLPDRFWKWRMHGGAITLARKFRDSSFKPDLILVTDMLDVNVLLSLMGARAHEIPVVLYMHENQLNYPWSPDDDDTAHGRDHHYAFINYASAVRADHILFNSDYHHSAFTGTLPTFLNMYPDYQETSNVEAIRNKSTVLPLGVDLAWMDAIERKAQTDAPVVLWNHRWEFDKDPESFFALIDRLSSDGLDFRLIVCGEHTGKYPAIFDSASKRYSDISLHWGYAGDKSEYCALLKMADIMPVTSNQDFFGISAVEAMYCGVTPILPRRLAFPEHVPSEYHNRFLYNDTSDLLEKVLHALNAPVDRELPRSWASAYAWSNLISRYDELLSSFAA